MHVEISENPEVLIHSSIPVTRLQLLGRCLYDNASLLNLNEATNALGSYPDGVTRVQYRQGHVFCILNGIEIEYILSDRIAAVVQNGGWLTFANEYKFRIWHGTIVEIAIHGGVLSFFENLRKSEMVQQFGKPDFVYEWADHGDLMQTDFVYNREIRVSYDDWKNKIDNINIGESVTYGKHGKRECVLPMTH